MERGSASRRTGDTDKADYHGLVQSLIICLIRVIRVQKNAKTQNKYENIHKINRSTDYNYTNND